MLKLKLQYFGHLMRKVDSLEKTLMLGVIGGRRRRGTTEDEMAGWHHRLDGHEYEQTPGADDGQGGLACCDSWGCKELDTTERLNWTVLISTRYKMHLKPKVSIIWIWNRSVISGWAFQVEKNHRHPAGKPPVYSLTALFLFMCFRVWNHRTLRSSPLLKK